MLDAEELKELTAFFDENAETIAYGVVSERTKPGTEELDAWFAATVCGILENAPPGQNTFVKQKSGYIFSTEAEALDYADFMTQKYRADMVAQMMGDLRNSLRELL